MKWACLFGIMVVWLYGCASTGQKGMFDGAVKAQLADSVKVADKFTDKIDGKIDIRPETQIQAGLTNTVDRSSKDTNTNVKGNLTNDSALMTQYIEALKEQSTKLIEQRNEADNRFMTLLKIFISSLFALIFKYELNIRTITKRLLDARDKDDENEQKMLDKALNK